MGKTQSKRSVDITTEMKKGVDDEVTEKMEKIEDLDKKDVNGDATVQSQSEKKEDNDVLENDKDIATEKGVDIETNDEPTDNVKSPKTDSKNDDSATEEISPLCEESTIKKSKKEKVKKKWSFRSISFGKKDKQKPGKTEDTPESASATVNGTDEEKPSTETEESQKEQTFTNNTPDETTEMSYENGNASEAEINGQQTEDKSDNMKQNEEAFNTNNPITENNDMATNGSVPLITSQETEPSSTLSPKSELIENDRNLKENAKDETFISGNSAEEINGKVHQSTDVISDETTAENENIPANVKTETISANGTVEEIHQNGSNNVYDGEDEESKAHIEVNINKEKKNTAETLETISSSSSNNPSTAQVIFQNLNTSGVTFDDVGTETIAQNHVFRDLITDSENKSTDAIICENELKSVKTVDEKVGQEPSPPPLPISPPPSQVSVFAFTNNIESDNESLEKSEDISTQVEEIEIKATSPIGNNSNQDSNIAKKQFEEAHTSTSKGTVLENISLNEEIVGDENIGEINTDSNGKKDNEIEIKISCMESGDPYVNEITQAECSKNEGESLGKCVTDEETINLAENGNEKTFKSNMCGESHNSVNTNQLPTANAEDSCQNSANTDIIDINHKQANNSPESLSSIILAKNDVLDDCLTPLNIHKTHDDIKMVSGFDNIVGEETKEFGNHMDLKESVTAAEMKQDSSVMNE